MSLRSTPDYVPLFPTCTQRSVYVPAEHPRLCTSVPHMHAEIKRLMGCFLFAHRGLEHSPYSDLLDPWHWTEVADMFAKDACKLLGLSLESPLRVR